jgi:hypothetical protein
LHPYDRMGIPRQFRKDQLHTNSSWTIACYDNHGRASRERGSWTEVTS